MVELFCVGHVKISAAIIFLFLSSSSATVHSIFLKVLPSIGEDSTTYHGSDLGICILNLENIIGVSGFGCGQYVLTCDDLDFSLEKLRTLNLKVTFCLNNTRCNGIPNLSRQLYVELPKACWRLDFMRRF
jgi:hypothetical protein